MDVGWVGVCEFRMISIQENKDKDENKRLYVDMTLSTSFFASTHT